ncbi:dachshund homolog 2-like isoform X3 [Argiope bruennichi]|uniref:dachshund homolog 2-like isoform X3 n=1 Tax=Argiope bruennichi TaxID=94029 RepID=UPI0024942D9E|nr:dachshund homolog 2-like isoform X3 [Argiope bruennichi]
MEGSSGDGSTSPSADMPSPPSLHNSPNPDSSVMVGDCVTSAANLMCPPMSTNNPVVSMQGLVAASSPSYQQQRTSSVSPPQMVSKPYTPPMSTAAMAALSAGKPQLEHMPAHMGMLAMRNGGVHHHGYLGAPPRLERPMHPISPPGITTDATANDCRLIDYRGAKVAAFLVNGDYLLCLPQAFELFLKHLVGGLHTVYTKLKRLDITPIVCNVEQVRILRGLGAIQPGVNRCKLLSCKDFDTLYKDCTTARPGRPPKRATMVGINPNGANHSMLLKKSRMDGEYPGYENGHIGGDRVDKSHLLANGYSHHVAAAQAAVVAATAGAPPHLNPLPFMALNHAAAAAAHHNSMLSGTLPLAASSSHGHLNSSTSSGRGPESSSVIKERNSHNNDVINSTRLRDDRGDMVDSKERLYGFDSHRMKDQAFLNGYFWLLAGAQANGHSPVLNLSQHSSRPSNSSNNSNNNNNPTTNGPGSGGGGGGGGGAGGENSGSENAYNDGADDDDNDSEDDDDDDREQDLSDNPDVSSTANTDRLTSSQHPLAYPAMGGDVCPIPGQTASSMETLLRNIQGLLKVAADNARQQERQISLEKAELKMELLREREVREGIEKQLLDEQRTRILYQKRLKKEKRTRRRVQEQLEAEVKKRAQYEEALRSNSAEALRLLNESLAQELERERNARAEAEHKMQDCPMSV